MISEISKVYLTIAILIICIVFIPLFAFPMLEENWPTYMGNNFLTGNNDGIPLKGFNLIWSFSRGGILYNPVPVNGKLFVVSTDQYLYCLDEETGKLIWNFKADAPLTRMVAVYKGNVILPGGRFIYCLDEKTGKLLWARRDKTFGFYGTPTVANGKIFYGNRKGFYARDVNSGKLIWSNNNIYTYGGFPAYWNEYIYTVSKDFNEGTAYLYALNAKDGSISWKAQLENYSNIYSPVIYDRRIYLTAGYSIYVFNVENGKLINEVNYKKPVYSTPIFSQGFLYFSLADGEIIKLNPKNYSYSVVFKVPIGTQFSVVGSYLYIPEKKVLNDIAVVNSISGKLSRRVPIPGGEPFTFTIARGKMFVPSSRKLYAIGKGGIEIVSQKVEGESISKGKSENLSSKLSKRLEMADIKGKVYDKETKNPINSGDITATTKLNNGKIIVKESRINNGEFSIKIPKKGKTDLIISSGGYLFKDIVLPDEKAVNDLSTEPLELSLSKIESGEKLSVQSIYFDTGSANLGAESLPTLNKLLKIMKEKPDIRIEIDGHTDSTGIKDFNMRLSLMRANEVKYWLVRNGVLESRITTKGFGDTKPIADNLTPEGRSKNRRTEITIKNDH